jgi:thiosulfate/3-mercaptopyruvate sulfurtransferase
MALTTLVDAQYLAGHLFDERLRIVDCRFDLKDVAWGEQAYLEGHIPAAVYANLDRDLSGHKTGSNGRHPLPEPASLAETLGRLGIDGSIQVVAYDQDSGMYASRLWWLLRWLGHDAVAVLDGGLAKWQAEGRPLREGAETPPARTFVPDLKPRLVADLNDVREAIATGDRLLVDARAPERFRGESEPLDRVPGHIPGAVNHFFKWNLNDDGTFRSPEELHERLRRSIGNVPAERITCYCGSGVTACHNLLAFEHAGLGLSRLYVGSWSEWSSDPTRPVQTSRTTE